MQGSRRCRARFCENCDGVVFWCSVVSLLVPMSLMAASTARADIHFSVASGSTVYDYSLAGSFIGSRATGGDLNTPSLNGGAIKCRAAQPVSTVPYTGTSMTGAAPGVRIIAGLMFLVPRHLRPVNSARSV